MIIPKDGAMLEPDLNTFPESTRHIHFMGVCGTGMAAMAAMLKSQGYIVTGSDVHVYPPMSDFLANAGIVICDGYNAANLNPRPDLVIVGNVITRKNTEAIALASLRIPYLSFPQLLNRRFLASKKSVVVAGTHGKTTTSSLLATLLYGAGLEPGFLIGGIVQAFSCNFRVGDGPYFVVEGDEYDTAFFDKGPKFLHYSPHIAIITSIEFDHADIYADLESVKKSFRRLIAIMPKDGCLVAHLDDPVVAELVADAPCRVVGYGNGPHCDWVLSKYSCDVNGSSFDALYRSEHFGYFETVMPGKHNCLNALAVIAVLADIGVSPKIISHELKKFKGVKRRQEVRGEIGGVTVIDDFAHHPTAVRETIAALKAVYAQRRLIVVFEPRTNSSRRRVFQQDYLQVFDKADMIIVKEPEPLVALPEDQRFSAKELVSGLVGKGSDAYYFPTTDKILGYLMTVVSSGDVVAVMSNGGFDNIHVRLLDMLSKQFS